MVDRTLKSSYYYHYYYFCVNMILWGNWMTNYLCSRALIFSYKFLFSLTVTIGKSAMHDKMEGGGGGWGGGGGGGEGKGKEKKGASEIHTQYHFIFFAYQQILLDHLLPTIVCCLETDECMSWTLLVLESEEANCILGHCI